VSPDAPRLTPSHVDRLAAESLELVDALVTCPWAEDFYLAGSAALALYVAHRPVRGLDLMAGTHRLTSPDRRDLMETLLPASPGVKVETARDGFLHVRAASGVGAKLFYYPYPLIAPLEDLRGLPVASAVDLGLMKIGAIISRGTKRDFVDLYLLCRQLPLAHLLERAPEKFGHVRDFPLQALKGLADLEQTEGEPMPRLAVEVEWAEVEEWVRTEVRELGRRYVGLG
jgi:hypothetical protein